MNGKDESNPSMTQPSAEDEKHRAAERCFWKQQIRIAKWLNIITAGAAAVALVGLVFVYLSIVHADQATVEANRAWIAPRTVYLADNFVLGKHPRFRISFDNAGKEPAINTELRTQILVVDGAAVDAALRDISLWSKSFGRNTGCDRPPKNSGTEPYWPSAQPESYTLFFGGVPGDPVVTQEVLDGRQAIIVNGCVFYETFGQRRFSKFCFLLRQTPSHILTIKDPALICPDGNGAT